MRFSDLQARLPPYCLAVMIYPSELKEDLMATVMPLWAKPAMSVGNLRRLVFYLYDYSDQCDRRSTKAIGPPGARGARVYRRPSSTSRRRIAKIFASPSRTAAADVCTEEYPSTSSCGCATPEPSTNSLS